MNTFDTRNRWRRVVAGKISHMTLEQARAILDAIRARGVTIHHPEIRELTGGFASQSINAHVIRRLGIKAGIIRNAE